MSPKRRCLGGRLMSKAVAAEASGDSAAPSTRLRKASVAGCAPKAAAQTTRPAPPPSASVIRWGRCISRSVRNDLTCARSVLLKWCQKGCQGAIFAPRSRGAVAMLAVLAAIRSAATAATV